MSVVDFITGLKKNGIKIKLVDNQLKIKANKESLSEEILSELKDRKTEIINFLKQYTNNRDFSKIRNVEKKEYYHLSPAQKRMFLLHQMEFNSIVYNIHSEISLKNNITKEQIEDTFRKLITKHENLRTSFELLNGTPVQILHESVYFEIIEKHVTEKEIKEAKKHFKAPFNLNKVPLIKAELLRIGNENSILLIDMHHIIGDDTSQAILEKDFSEAFNGRKMIPSRIQYKDYSEWQNSKKQKNIRKQQETYWLNRFKGDIPVLELPTDFQRPTMRSFDGATVDFLLNNNELKCIKQLIKECEITLFMANLAILNIFLHKITGKEDIIIGVPVAGRSHIGLKKVVGIFVNTIATRNFPMGNKTIRDFIEELKLNTLNDFENQEYQFEDLVDKVSVGRDTSRNPLFDVVCNLVGQSGAKEDNIGSKHSLIHKKGIARFDLTFTIIEKDDQVLLKLEYCTKLFKLTTINRFITFFKKIVDQIHHKIDKKISEIDILPENDKSLILSQFNDTLGYYPKGKTVPELFREQVIKYPDKISIVANNVSLTYDELDKRSNQISAILLNNGCKHNSVVGLYFDRSAEMIISMLGVLKIGGVFMPVDVDYPESRKRMMINDSGLDIILTLEKHELHFLKELPNVKSIKIDEPVKSSGYELSKTGLSSDPAYIMYTSGSTGIPKGVIVVQKNIIRLVKNTNFLPLSNTTNILQTGAPVFDATTIEIWGALLNGGTLNIVEKETILNAEKLSHSLQKSSINTLWLSSSLFNQLILEKKDMFCGIKYLLVGGDIVSAKHVRLAYENNPGIHIINGYGPTENTTFSTTYEIPPNISRNVPIGKPIKNSTAYIFDKNYQLKPIGITGELCVGGEGVALGYLNAQELTNKKFVPNPMQESDTLYCTNDLAKWTLDGNIEFLGREDNQVKIRGYRIELGEIEVAMESIDEIKEAIVVVKMSDKEEKYICAYLTSEKDIETLDIRSVLLDQLPGYMIPTYFIQLEKLPLNSNGKVDRKSLPEPDVIAGENHVTPSNVIEENILEIWSDVLNIEKEKISVNANFFELGGHSMNVIKVTAEIDKNYKTKISLSDFYQNPDIKSLAKCIYINKGIKDLEVYNEESLPKIFCFPPMISYGYCYAEMAMGMKDYCFYAFNITEGENPIEHYSDIILKSGERNDYILLGYSAGGKLACLVAQELEKKGLNVSKLILLDGYWKEDNVPVNKKNIKELVSEHMDMIKEDIIRSKLDYMIPEIRNKITAYAQIRRNKQITNKLNAEIHYIIGEDSEETNEIIQQEIQSISAKPVFMHQGYGEHNYMIENEALIKNSELIEQLLNITN